jgi:uncharacterized protein YabN with tetrapyrrole methylase and pyrophosphatase domain
MLTELERVAQWNERAGVEKKYREITDSEILDQKSFIQEEYRELMEDGFDMNNRREVVDACGDLLVVVAGMLYRLGYNPERVLQLINDSNYSKFVYISSDAHATMEKYSSDPRYDNVSVDDKGVVRGTVIETGSNKILKGINYEPPALDKLHGIS